MKIKLNENQLNQLINECVKQCINEIAGYKDTMAKADKAFDLNTPRGVANSIFRPKKLKQFLKAKAYGDIEGQFAARDLNREYKRVPLNNEPLRQGYDFPEADWDTYAIMNGRKGENGEEIFNNRTKNYRDAINKYGTNGVKLEPSFYEPLQ